MQVSKAIATTVFMDYESMYCKDMSKQEIVKKLAKIWSLTLPEVVEIIKTEEAEQTASELGEIV